MMPVRIPSAYIPKFRRKGIDLSEGRYLADGTFGFLLLEKDEEKFLEIMKEEVVDHAEEMSDRLIEWIQEEEFRLAWKKRLADITDPFAPNVDGITGPDV